MLFLHRRKTPSLPVRAVSHADAAQKPADAAQKPADAVPTPAVRSLLHKLETFSVGMLFAGLLAAFQAYTAPAVFLHPDKAAGELIGAALSAMFLYASKSGAVREALAAGLKAEKSCE